MQNIAIDAPALELLLRIGLSCLAQPRNLATRFELLYKLNAPTIFDLFAIIPSISVDLLKYCDETNPFQTTIEENDILIVFSRYDHLTPSIGYLKNPANWFASENQMYSERLNELGVNLATRANQATFLFGDLLTFGQINKLSANKCSAEVASKTQPLTMLQNATIPKHLQQNTFPGKRVCVHFGVIVFISKAGKHEVLFDLLLAEQKRFFASDSLLRDVPRLIDYMDFCPQKTKKGANLAQWSRPLLD